MTQSADPGDPGAPGPAGEQPVDGAGHGWPGASSQGERHRSGFLAALREFTIIIVGALVISALVRTFVVQAFWVPSGSMETTLERGDRILAWKPGGEPGRGDVVVFHDPADWLADPIAPTGMAGTLTRIGVFLGVLPSETGDDLVKRVIGIGGDTVMCCSPDGRIIRNGEPIDEPYIYPGDATDQVRFNITVPQGRLFVMGDHRSDSADSRYHLEDRDGTVPVENVVGHAVVIMWPISRWATLPDYQDAS